MGRVALVPPLPRSAAFSVCRSVRAQPSVRLAQARARSLIVLSERRSGRQSEGLAIVVLRGGVPGGQSGGRQGQGHHRHAEGLGRGGHGLSWSVGTTVLLSHENACGLGRQDGGTPRPPAWRGCASVLSAALRTGRRISSLRWRASVRLKPITASDRCVADGGQDRASDTRAITRQRPDPTTPRSDRYHLPQRARRWCRYRPRISVW